MSGALGGRPAAQRAGARRASAEEHGGTASATPAVWRTSGRSLGHRSGSAGTVHGVPVEEGRGAIRSAERSGERDLPPGRTPPPRLGEPRADGPWRAGGARSGARSARASAIFLRGGRRYARLGERREVLRAQRAPDAALLELGEDA